MEAIKNIEKKTDIGEISFLMSKFLRPKINNHPGEKSLSQIKEEKVPEIGNTILKNIEVIKSEENWPKLIERFADLISAPHIKTDRGFEVDEFQETYQRVSDEIRKIFIEKEKSFIDQLQKFKTENKEKISFYEDERHYLNILQSLIENSNDKEKEVISSMIDKGIDINETEKRLIKWQNPIKRPEIIGINNSFVKLELISRFGNKEKKDWADKIIEKMLSEQNNDYIKKNILGFLFLSDNKKFRDKAEDLLRPTLAKYNLNTEDIFMAWRDDNVESTVQDNLSAIEMLEKERKGICKTLFEEFNIAFFSIYPKELLIKQFDQRNNLDFSRGIIISNRYKMGGHGKMAPAFVDKKGKENGKSVLEKLNENNITAMLFEANSPFDLARMLLKLRKRYNPKNDENKNILFACTNGHGLKRGIKLSDKYMLTPAFLQGEGTKKLSKFFNQNCHFIAGNCYVGEKNGFIQLASERIEGIFTGCPDTVSTIDLDVEIIAGSPKFKIIYNNKPKRLMNYIRGKENKLSQSIELSTNQN